MFTATVATIEPHMLSGFMEGSPKWFGLEPDIPLLDQTQLGLPRKFVNFDWSFDPIYISLTDHRAATLTTVLNATQTFIQTLTNQGSSFKMLLLGGNAGIDAATNIVVHSKRLLFVTE